MSILRHTPSKLRFREHRPTDEALEAGRRAAQIRAERDALAAREAAERDAAFPPILNAEGRVVGRLRSDDSNRRHPVVTDVAGRRSVLVRDVAAPPPNRSQLGRLTPTADRRILEQYPEIPLAEPGTPRPVGERADIARTATRTFRSIYDQWQQHPTSEGDL